MLYRTPCSPLDIYLPLHEPLSWAHEKDRDEVTLIIVLKERERHMNRSLQGSKGALMYGSDEPREGRESRDPCVEKSGAQTSQIWVEISFESTGTSEMLGKLCFFPVASS